jgi:hypothetical protein
MLVRAYRTRAAVLFRVRRRVSFASVARVVRIRPGHSGWPEISGRAF